MTVNNAVYSYCIINNNLIITLKPVDIGLSLLGELNIS